MQSVKSKLQNRKMFTDYPLRNEEYDAKCKVSNFSNIGLQLQLI